jgi:xylan 1,4-beta-xylosidase
VAPPQGVNDQAFYKQEQPSLPAGTATLRVGHLPAGTYGLEVYRTGFRVNDPYTMYLDMGAPSQLTRAQVEALQQGASGAPVEQVVVKHSGGAFARDFPLRQNDVVLVVLRKL